MSASLLKTLEDFSDVVFGDHTLPLYIREKDCKGHGESPSMRFAGSDPQQALGQSK
jgi:hypothetical protein